MESQPTFYQFLKNLFRACGVRGTRIPKEASDDPAKNSRRGSRDRCGVRTRRLRLENRKPRAGPRWRAELLQLAVERGFALAARAPLFQCSAPPSRPPPLRLRLLGRSRRPSALAREKLGSQRPLEFPGASQQIGKNLGRGDERCGLAGLSGSGRALTAAGNLPRGVVKAEARLGVHCSHRAHRLTRRVGQGLTHGATTKTSRGEATAATEALAEGGTDGAEALQGEIDGVLELAFVDASGGELLGREGPVGQLPRKAVAAEFGGAGGEIEKIGQ